MTKLMGMDLTSMIKQIDMDIGMDPDIMKQMGMDLGHMMKLKQVKK